MTELLVFAGLGLALLLALLWLVQQAAHGPRPSSATSELSLEGLLPRHSRYFPLIQQALSEDDQVFLKARASRRIHRVLHAERRQVVQQYLTGLREDFLNLECLGRTVAALSPRVSRKLEAERFWLGVEFRVMYQLVRLRLELGMVSLPQVERLTQLMGSLAARVEAAMTALEQTSPERLRSDLSV